REAAAPDVGIARRVLFISRMVAAMTQPIGDPVEVFRYWEALHYLLYGSGLQVAGWAPSVAQHAWAYVGLHGLPALAADTWFNHRYHVFYSVRVVLAFASAL
ncbi:hypothetical protein CXG81DRAFT_2395, partial [Caulochytrium protostelioides]